MTGKKRLALLLFGPLLLAGLGGWMYFAGGRFVSSENAYVKADKIAISSDLDGRVTELAVAENQQVEAGQLLFRIDPQPHQIALAKAEAELGMVEHDIASYRSAYRRELARLALAEDNLDFAEKEFRRQQNLRGKKIVSQAEFDQVRHRWRAARQALAAAEEDIRHALTSLGGDPDTPVEQHPRHRQAQAARAAALFDLERTVIRAPAAGVVSNLNLQVGEYVEAGEPLFAVVAAGADKLWVTANLKETQLAHVSPGQLVTLRADTFPGREWRAVVDSISPATGAEFALLPAQNASGNWVKVVQRVPVRIRFAEGTDAAPLRAGMSVEVSIDTGYRRPLAAPLAAALRWLRDKATATAEPLPQDVTVFAESLE